MTFEYQVLHDSDIAYVTAKINAMAAEGWRVHALTTAVVPGDDRVPHQVFATVLLERAATPGQTKDGR